MEQAAKAHLIQAAKSVGDLSTGSLMSIHQTLVAECGLVVTLALYLAVGAVAVMLIWRVVKFSFDVVRCVALPATAVALLGAWLLPFPFLHIFPVAAAVFAVLLLIRG